MGFRETRHVRVLACAALAGCLAGCVDERTDPVSGADLYRRHCASCHGVEGRGDGPLAASLRTPPSDLTALARRAGGFDESAVMAVIDGRRAVTEHGPREMPVWGAVFESGHREAREPYPAYTSLLDARALTDYLRSIQGPGRAAEPGA